MLFELLVQSRNFFLHTVHKKLKLTKKTYSMAESSENKNNSTSELTQTQTSLKSKIQDLLKNRRFIVISLTAVVLATLVLSSLALLKFDRDKKNADAGLNVCANTVQSSADTSNQIDPIDTDKTIIGTEPKADPGSIVPNQYIVKLKTAIEVGDDTGLLDVKSQKLVVKEKLFDNTYLVEVSPDKCKLNTLQGLSLQSLNTSDLTQETDNTIDTINRLRGTNNIEFIQPDILLKENFSPNDPFLSSQQIVDKIGLKQAWDSTQGSADVVVAVIDSGVDFNHPDLKNKLYRDAQGKVIGYNYVNNGTEAIDTRGHGTGVAGVIAAETNNAIGMAGVCPQCKIMPLKTSRDDGNSTSSSVIQAIDFAIEKGAKVINMSLGSAYSGSSDPYSYSTSKAYNAGVTVIASAGNSDNTNLEYPASSGHVISVAAVNNDDTKSSFSSYNDRVDVSAQGVNVTCTVPPGSNINTFWGDGNFSTSNDGYGNCDGTSISAPIVAGLAGLIISKNPEYKADQVSSIIRKSADNINSINPNYTGKLGSGRINAARAMNTNPGTLLSNSDISSINCASPIPVNQKTNCTITLAGGKNFADLTGSIKLKIGDYNFIDPTICPSLPISGNTLTCSVPIRLFVWTK